jgi:hypothetical protein
LSPFVSSQGTVCDVREGKDVKELVEFARDKLGYIDIWVSSDPSLTKCLHMDFYSAS